MVASGFEWTGNAGWDCTRKWIRGTLRDVEARHRRARERLVAVEEEGVKKQESPARFDPSSLPPKGEGGLYAVFERIPECRKASGIRFNLPAMRRLTMASWPTTSM